MDPAHMLIIFIDMDITTELWPMTPECSRTAVSLHDLYGFYFDNIIVGMKSNNSDASIAKHIYMW